MRHRRAAPPLLGRSLLRHEVHLCAHRYAAPSDPPTALLVGEDNPRSEDPRHALYPYPPGCAGERMARIAGWGTRGQLMRWRTNLCLRAWDEEAARGWALALLRTVNPPWCAIVLLGRKVARAFRAADCLVSDEPPFTVCYVPGAPPLLLLPHPSGRCRAWNDPNAAARARALLAEVEGREEEG